MNLRKDNNGEALKAWKKLSPGHIAKPLRHIGNRTNKKASPQYKDARIAAICGDGERVQRIARSLA